MRDLRIKQTRSKRSRRTALALLVLAVSPAANAQQPFGSSARILPPLPLESISQGQVRVNPFCEPDDFEVATDIQLASGRASIRLKPVQGELGLHTIDAPTEATSQPALTVGPTPTAAVQQNPLIKSLHHDNPDLVDAEVIDQTSKKQFGAVLGMPSGAPIAVGAVPTSSRPAVDAPCPTACNEDASKLSSAEASAIAPSDSFEHDAWQQAGKSADRTTSKSSIVLIQPVTPQPLQVDPDVEHTASPVKIVAPAKILAPLPANGSGDSLDEPVRLAEVPSKPDAEPLEQEPVFFSFSDSAEPVDNSEAVAAAQPIADGLAKPAHDELDAPMPLVAEDENEPTYFHFADDPNRADNADASEQATDVIEGLLQPEEPIDALTLDEVELNSALPQPTPHEFEAEFSAGAAMPLHIVLDAEPAGGATNSAAKPGEVERPRELPAPLTPVPSSRSLPMPPSHRESPYVAEALPIPLDAPQVGQSVPDNQPKPGPMTAKIQPSDSPAIDVAAQSLRAQRYRPPVAVTPVPITYSRNGVDGATAALDTSPRVQPVSRPDLASTGSSQVLASQTKLTPLYMKSAQVRSLTVAGKLRDIQVADTNVCQAVAAGPNQVKLIGTGNGVTQLVVWAQTDDPAKPFKMRAFEVHVDRVDPSVEAGGSMARLLDESIRNAFPQCEIALSQEGGELIVSGRCDSDESAEKIIRMIRKTCLVPVQDRLMVR